MGKNVWEREQRAGLVVGNASIAADVSPKGRLFQRIVFNPPCFTSGENGLEEAGESGLFFTVDGAARLDTELSWDILERDYPRYRARAALPGGSAVEVTAFAPVAAGDAEPMFLPALLYSLRFTGGAREQEISLRFVWEAPGLGEADAPSGLMDSNRAVKQSGDRFAALECAPPQAGRTWGGEDALELAASFRLEAGGSQSVRGWLGVFPQAHRYRTRVDSVQELCGLVSRNFSGYERQLEDFIALVPDTGDPLIYRYTRWYMQAAVMLTKGDVTGRVITMGYQELNQRDSFWTSYVHLILWPSLEQTMLRESCLWQREDGKIPTTLLPRYERECDIDINEYFCLRIGRYYRRHRDRTFLRECWPCFVKAVDFLLSRDLDGDGLPEQAPPENPLNFWADWKDVRGISGRKLAPHFTLLWLAVLREGAYLARALGDWEREERFAALLHRAKIQVNLDPAQGGLWQGGFYAEIWYDGHAAPQVLEDQTAGMAFGVVPPERAALIYRSLAAGENGGGIPETFPYREGMEYAPGVYHNGGIWPFLIFCDCMGRYKYGFGADAERLIRKVGYADLEAPGDWAPNEYLNALTLENCGYEVQGWSSALYGAITCGAFEVEWRDERHLFVRVNLPPRDFSTLLLLPEPFGPVRIWRENGALGHSGPDAVEGKQLLLEGRDAEK